MCWPLRTGPAATTLPAGSQFGASGRLGTAKTLLPSEKRLLDLEFGLGGHGQEERLLPSHKIRPVGQAGARSGSCVRLAAAASGHLAATRAARPAACDVRPRTFSCSRSGRSLATTAAKSWSSSPSLVTRKLIRVHWACISGL